MTMTIIRDFALKAFAPSRSEDQVLLVMLPGAYMKAEDFAVHAFFHSVRERSWPIDMIAVETGMDCYMSEEIVERLHGEVILPARSQGARRIWLVGISLGGMGALLYAQAHPDIAEGLILISPFIGSRGIITEIEDAGGLRDWISNPDQEAPLERRLLEWLRTYRAEDPKGPDIHLAYGEEDRFGAAHRLFANILPPDKVLTARGGHDWTTWKYLWEQLLHKRPFQLKAPAVTAL